MVQFVCFFFFTRKYYLVAERLVSRVTVLLYSYYLSSGRIQNLFDGDSTNINNLTEFVGDWLSQCGSKCLNIM